MLHDKTHNRDSTPTCCTNRNWLSTRFDQLNHIAVKSNGCHSHNDQNLDNSLSGANTLESTPKFTQIVVKIAAKIK